MNEKATKWVKTADAMVGMVIADHIYAPGNTGLMIARGGAKLDETIIKQLNRYEIKGFEIIVPGEAKKPPAPAIKVDLVETEVPEEHEAPVVVIPQPRLRSEAIIVIRDLFTVLQNPDSYFKTGETGVVVKRFEDVLNRLVTHVASDISEFIHMQDTVTAEELPYHHSISVAALAIVTGQALGLEMFQIFKLARCAALHDIGRIKTPRNLRRKTSALTGDEYEVVKTHAADGANLVKAKGYGDLEIWNGITFHHEKVDGTGYPRRLSGDDIPLFSRIIAVVDTYDAVTSLRPYREPMSPSAAFDLISSEVGKAFDYDVVKAFTKSLMLYPVGIKVGLNDGREGIVTDNKNALRPIVEIEGTGELLDLWDIKNLHMNISRINSK